jgi:hypothetical protein
MDGGKTTAYRRSLLRDRLNSAHALRDRDLEVVVVQTEALANFRRE